MFAQPILVVAPLTITKRHVTVWTSEVVADYSTTYEAIDWDAVAVEVPDVVARHTTIKMVTDYRAMCKGLGIDPVIVSKTGPSVTVKLEA